VDWALEELEDRVEQSAWDMIPPYQNEDDEGILPSHSHPSYPFGNPYDPTQVPVQIPQLARVVNQPLAVGSALLLPGSSGEAQGQAYWAELATDQLLRPSATAETLDDPHSDELPPDQHHHHHHRPSDASQQHAISPTTGLHSHLRTPASDPYPPIRPPATDQTEPFVSEDDDQLSAETGAMLE